MAYREGRRLYLIRAGFTKSEARELSHTSTAGMRAPYFRIMVMARRGLLMNAKRWGWSDARYRREVYRRYVAKGLMEEGERWEKNLVWAMLRYYEEIFPPPDEYESPWRKRAQKKQKARRQQRRVTRRSMLSAWISDLDRSISKARSEPRRQKLIAQKQALEAQLSRLQ